MLSLLSLVAALPWRWLAAITCASIIFSAGVRLGEQRITTQWDAAKITAAQAVARQTNQVAQVSAKQTTINQEISNEFKAAKAQLAADRQHLLARVPGRVRLEPNRGDSTVSGVPVSSDGVAAASTDAVPSSDSTCEKLAEDASQTTLMLIEFQRWYQAQVAVFSEFRLP